MKRAAFTIFTVVVGSVAHVQASVITDSLSTTASGTLGGSSFTNALVTVTLIADTDNVVPGPDPFSSAVANSGTATVNVTGIGAGAFADQIGIIFSLDDAAALAFF